MHTGTMYLRHQLLRLHQLCCKGDASSEVISSTVQDLCTVASVTPLLPNRDLLWLQW